MAGPEAHETLIGFAPQDKGVYLMLSVRENLAVFGELAGLRGKDLKQSIDRVAEMLELTDLLDRQCQQMSGGEQRRVHTAMALLHRPPLLLLDEPTTGVDVSTRNRLLETVKRMAAEGAQRSAIPRTTSPRCPRSARRWRSWTVDALSTAGRCPS